MSILDTCAKRIIIKTTDNKYIFIKNIYEASFVKIQCTSIQGDVYIANYGGIEIKQKVSEKEYSRISHATDIYIIKCGDNIINMNIKYDNYLFLITELNYIQVDTIITPEIFSIKYHDKMEYLGIREKQFTDSIQKICNLITIPRSATRPPELKGSTTYKVVKQKKI